MVVMWLLSSWGNSSVTLEKCQSPGACLLVTVLDHDTLRSDDFEGEAYLSLKAVPGVGGGPHNPEPAQIRLPLMHPKPNSMSLPVICTPFKIKWDWNDVGEINWWQNVCVIIYTHTHTSCRDSMSLCHLCFCRWKYVEVTWSQEGWKRSSGLR